MTNGLIFGKFAPLHNGHINFINQASLKVDILHVILCYDKKFMNTLPEYMKKKLSLRNRHLWLLETFKNQERIKIYVIDESHIESFPNGNYEFKKLITEVTNDIKFDFVFTNELKYKDFFKECYPNSKIIITDIHRKQVKISATAIRNNIYENWDYLPSAVQKDFIKKIAVIGVESTGKTTLCKMLAQYYKTNFTPEVARNYCEDEFFWNEKYMDINDYVIGAMKHKIQENENLKGANKVTFSDTNNFITLFSVVMQTNIISLDNNNPSFNILLNMSQDEINYYDLVLYLQNDVPWVDDGMRQNGTENKRLISQNVLDNVLYLCYKNSDYLDKIYKISGNWEERFNESVKLIDKVIYDK